MEHDLIGKTIGNYQLLQRLGAGATASVYKAHDTAHDRTVAIKILPIHLAANDTLRQRFLRESRMVAQLEHSNILPVYDFGEDGGAPYIVMQLVDGGTLDKLIERGPLPLLAVVHILTQVGRGLDYAHQQGVIHRDIKPENILFDRTGRVYLGDFGIARWRETSENLTGSGGFVGTAAYASPEQSRGEELTPASDLYSLGVVLYEMLTGKLPFSGPTPLAIMHQHMNEQPPNPLKHRSDLPLGIADMMRKALAKRPALRYQSAEALVSVLKKETGTSEAVPPPGPNPIFDKPPQAYTPPPLPDKLLRGLTPSPAAPLKPLRPVEPLEAQSHQRESILVFGFLLLAFALALVLLVLVLRG